MVLVEWPVLASTAFRRRTRLLIFFSAPRGYAGMCRERSEDGEGGAGCLGVRKGVFFTLAYPTAALTFRLHGRSPSEGGAEQSYQGFLRVGRLQDSFSRSSPVLALRSWLCAQGWLEIALWFDGVRLI